MEAQGRLTFPLLWGGGRWRGGGTASGLERSDDPRGAAFSCMMGPEILMAGRPFLLFPLRSEILDRSSDMASNQHAQRAGWREGKAALLSIGWSCVRFDSREPVEIRGCDCSQSTTRLMSRASQGWVASRCQRRLPTGFRSRGASVGKPTSTKHQKQRLLWRLGPCTGPQLQLQQRSCSAWAWARRGLGRQRGPRKNHPWTLVAVRSDKFQPPPDNQQPKNPPPATLPSNSRNPTRTVPDSPPYIKMSAAPSRTTVVATATVAAVAAGILGTHTM